MIRDRTVGREVAANDRKAGGPRIDTRQSSPQPGRRMGEAHALRQALREAQVPGERGRLENGAPSIESHFLGQCLRSDKAADFRQQLPAREDAATERSSDGS